MQDTNPSGEPTAIEPEVQEEKTDRPYDSQRIPEETELKIAQLRMQGVPTRECARICGVSTGTVTNAFRRYLREHAMETLGDPRQIGMEVVTRLWQNANNARRDYLGAEEAKDRNAFLTTERQAIMDIAKLCGIDITRIQVVTPVAPEEQDQELTDILSRLVAIEAESSETTK